MNTCILFTSSNNFCYNEKERKGCAEQPWKWMIYRQNNIETKKQSLWKQIEIFLIGIFGYFSIVQIQVFSRFKTQFFLMTIEFTFFSISLFFFFFFPFLSFFLFYKDWEKYKDVFPKYSLCW
jgi:hypothetical protein